MLKLKLQYFGHPMQRANSLKDPDAGKDWRREEKGMTEVVGCHHQLNGYEFEQALGDGEGQKPDMLRSMRLQSQTWLSD